MTEWHASEYSRQSSLQTAMAEENVALLQLLGNERILDVGCGDGKITAEIAARIPQGFILGVDPSHEMIAFASGHFVRPQYGNIRFEVADARRLPYRADFDLIVSFNALHWVTDQEPALQSIRAALKPGGRVLLRLVPQGPRQSLEETIEEVRSRPVWKGYFQNFNKPYVHFTPEAYRALAEKCGLHILSLNATDKAWDFQTREAFAAFARATFVEWTRCLPKNLWNDFITEVLDQYRKVAADDSQQDNTFKFYQMEVWLTSDAGGSMS
jgi:trans-aconitate 2-methyltransferase